MSSCPHGAKGPAIVESRMYDLHILTVLPPRICLICGHVGCGRYKGGHAYDHFKGSQHCYALELETQRVWDYVGDNYVHRLIQSKTDGKLVEVPSPGMASGATGPLHNRQGSCSLSDPYRRQSVGLGGDDGSGQADDDLKEAMISSKLDAVSQGELLIFCHF